MQDRTGCAWIGDRACCILHRVPILNPKTSIMADLSSSSTQPAPASDRGWVQHIQDRTPQAWQALDEALYHWIITHLRDRQVRDVRQEWETRTAADGSYRFADVPVGKYELGVQLPPQHHVDGFQWQDVDVKGPGGEIPAKPAPAPRPGWRLYLPTLDGGTHGHSFLDGLHWWV